MWTWQAAGWCGFAVCGFDNIVFDIDLISVHQQSWTLLSNLSLSFRTCNPIHLIRTKRWTPDDELGSILMVDEDIKGSSTQDDSFISVAAPFYRHIPCFSLCSSHRLAFYGPQHDTRTQLPSRNRLRLDRFVHRNSRS